MSAIESFSINEKSSYERELTVTVNNFEITKQYENLVKKIQLSASVKGFRAGKVPVDMIKKLYKDKIQQELVNTVVESSIDEICKTNNIFPISKAEFEPLESFAQNKDFTFTAKFQVKPNIEVSNFENLSFEVTNFIFDESDIDHELQNLRKKMATFITPQRTEITDSDLVIGDLQVKIDDEFKKEQEIKGHMIPIYENNTPESIKKALIGKKIGDEVIIEHEFALPHEHEHDHNHDQECNHQPQKKVAHLYFTISSIKEIILPAIDDDLARDISDKFQNLNELKETIKLSLANNKKQNDFLQKKYALTKALIDNNNFEVPPVLVQRIAMSIVDEMLHNENTKNLSKKEVEEMLKNNWHEIWPLAHERASFQLKSELIYENLIEKLNIASDSEIVAKLIKNKKMNVEEAEFSSKVDNLLKLIEEKSQITVVDKHLLEKGN